MRSTRPLVWGKRECQLNAKLVHGAAELGGCPHLLSGSRCCHEDQMLVGIQRYRYVPTPAQLLKKDEVVPGSLLKIEQGAGHTTTGVINRQEQREQRSLLSKSPAMLAVPLDQHFLTRHPLPTNTTLRRPTPRGLITPALTGMRCRVFLPISMPSLSPRNSLR